MAVTFPAGNLSTSSADGSGYAAGLPIDKWRLLAVPAVLTTATVAGVLGDELVDEVALAAHDLDAVVARVLSPLRAVGEGLDRPFHPAK